MLPLRLALPACVIVLGAMLAGGAAAVAGDATVVTITSPATGTVTSDRTPDFSGTGRADSVVLHVYAGAATGDPLHSLPAEVTGNRWTAPFAGELSDGQYSLRADATTGEETVSSEVVTFTVDGTAPTVTLEAPAAGSGYVDDTPTFTGIGGTAPGDIPEVTIEVSSGADPEPVLALSAAVDPSTGAWTATPGEAPNGSAAALVEGVFTVRVEQADAAGNVGVTPITSFAVDGTAPAFVPAAAGQTVEQTGAAGAVVAYVPPAVEDLDPAPAVTCSPAPGAVFPPGATTVSCEATDWAGNSAATQFTITVVNTVQPQAVRSLRARARPGRVVLSWNPPADWDYGGVVVRRARSGAADWQVVFESQLATAFTDRSARNDTQYVYEIRTRDTAGNVSGPASAAARPSNLFVPAWNQVWRGPRVARWTPVRRASYYNIQLWKNGRKVLSRWPERARFRVANSWKQGGRRVSLRRGTYRVYVWPGFGPKRAAKYGRLVGWTTFRIA